MEDNHGSWEPSQAGTAYSPAQPFATLLGRALTSSTFTGVRRRVAKNRRQREGSRVEALALMGRGQVLGKVSTQ